MSAISRICCIVGLWWGIACGLLQAAAPLTDFVAADAALYVEIANLDRDWQAFDESEFGRLWRDSALYAAISQSPPLRRWRTLDERVAEKTRQTLTGQLRRLFAESVGVALWLPQEGEPRAVLLARGASAAEVRATIDAWNVLEAQVQLTTRGTGDQRYTARSVGAAAPAIFYIVHENLFVLSDQESLVQDAARRIASASNVTDALSSDPGFLRAWPTQRESGTLLGYVAARAWDRTLRQLKDDTPDFQVFQAAWQGTDSLLGRIQWNAAGPLVELTANFGSSSTSSAWNRFAADATLTPERLSSIPPDALLVCAGRLDPAALIAGLRPLMPSGDRDKWDRAMKLAAGLFLGLDPWKDVGDSLLNDWSLYLVERPLLQQRPVRRHPFVAIWTSHFPRSTKQTELRSALENAISFFMNLALVALNSDAAGPNVTLQRPASDAPQSFRWQLTGRPEGELAVRLTDEQLLIASSTVELDSVVSSAPAAATEASRLLTTLQQRSPSPTVVCWCRIRTLREHGWWSWIHKHAIRPETPEQIRDAITTTGSILDEAYLTITCSPTQVRLQLGGVSRHKE